MKRHTFIMTLVAGGMALAMLSACHRSNDRNTGMEEQPSVAQVNSENIQPEQPDNLVDIRRPDVKIHVKRGQTLAMQTEGLTLTAVDAAVQHEADYSITSLVSEDLPPLPQGMMNMTAATAGYRLLPGLRPGAYPRRLFPRRYLHLLLRHRDPCLGAPGACRGGYPPSRNCLVDHPLHRLHQRAA